MIQEFVDRFMANKEALRKRFAEKHPANYDDVVRATLEVLKSDEYGSFPDASKLTVIDHGSYQGTLLYVVPAETYQPSTYWYVFVWYGSCSGCDTLENINGYGDDPPTPQQVEDYLGLALNIVQGLKKISAWSFDADTES